MAINKNFSIIFVTNWSISKVSERNKMRRIILFIDEVYNHKTKLFVLSEAGVENLFVKDDFEGSEESFMV